MLAWPKFLSLSAPVVLLAVLAAPLAAQYAILCKARRPATRLGLPYLGHSLRVFLRGVDRWAEELLAACSAGAVLTHFFGMHVVLIPHSVFRECGVEKRDR